MPINILIEAGQMVDALQGAVRSGVHGLSVLPGLLTQVIENEYWREWEFNYAHEIYRHDSFDAFVREGVPEGLGSDPETIQQLLQGFPEALTAFNRAIEVKPLAKVGEIGRGRDRVGQSNSITGNTSAYWASRLERDDPETLQAFRDGEYSSVKAAARAAGIVKERWSAPTDIDALARALRRRYGSCELKVLIDELSTLPATPSRTAPVAMGKLQKLRNS